MNSQLKIKNMHWISVEHELPKGGKVLATFLGNFFGRLSSEITTAYYDDPEDYQNPTDAKGWLDWYASTPLLVTHWMPLPDAAETSYEGQAQVDFEVKFGTMRPNLGSVYDGM